MDNKLNYQQAAQIRQRSIKDLIADELIRGKGVGGAISGAIGLRTQARIKGFKEKFDPLNIVKFLTFGSRLGPALYGRLFGRSRKDIEYFTGRASAIGERKKKITGLPGEGEDTGGMKEVLNQILTFLQKSHEDDMILREKENNLRESAKLEDDRRHKELIKALTGAGGVTVTAEKVKKGGGLMDGIMNIINGLRNQIQSLIDDFRDIKKWFGELGVLKNLVWLARIATGPIGLITALISYGLFSMWERDKKIAALAAQGDIEGLKTYYTNTASDEENLATGGGSADINAVRAVLQKAAEGGSIKAKEALDTLDKQQQEQPKTDRGYFDEYLAKKGYYASMGYKNLKGEKVSKQLIDEANQYASEKIGTPVNLGPKERVINQPVAPENMQFDVEGNLINLPTPKPPPAAAPTEPVSQKLNNLVQENASLNLTNSTTDKAMADAATNKVINTPNKGQYKKVPMPPVRNLEESFQRMIYNSTRVA